MSTDSAAEEAERIRREQNRVSAKKYRSRKKSKLYRLGALFGAVCDRMAALHLKIETHLTLSTSEREKAPLARSGDHTGRGRNARVDKERDV